MSDADRASRFDWPLKVDSDSFADELDRRYRERLCRLVQREMNRRCSRREDPEDVVQSVFRTFCRRAADGEFQIDHSAALWSLLRRITLRKTQKHIERIRAARRDPAREEYVEMNDLPDPGPSAVQARLLGDVLETVLDGMRPPEPEIMRLQLCGFTLEEIVRTILDGLEPPYPEILQLRLQGHSERAIGAKVGCGREAARYRLERISERLGRLLGDDPKE